MIAAAAMDSPWKLCRGVELLGSLHSLAEEKLAAGRAMPGFLQSEVLQPLSSQLTTFWWSEARIWPLGCRSKHVEPFNLQLSRSRTGVRVSVRPAAPRKLSTICPPK